MNFNYKPNCGDIGALVFQVFLLSERLYKHHEYNYAYSAQLCVYIVTNNSLIIHTSINLRGSTFKF